MMGARVFVADKVGVAEDAIRVLASFSHAMIAPSFCRQS